MLASPADVIGKAWQHIFADVTDTGLAIDQLSGSVVVLVAMGYAALGLALSWWRYQTIEVER